MADEGTLFGLERWSPTQLAEAFGLSTQRISQLTKEGVLPVPFEGRYLPLPAVRAYVLHLKKRDESPSKDGAALRKLDLANSLTEIKLKKVAGELVPVLQVEKDFFELARRIRDGLLNLPSRLAGPCAAEKNQEKIFELLTKEIHVALNELASGPTAGQEVSGAPVGEEPGQSREETDAFPQVADVPPAPPTFDEAFLARDRGADDQNGRFVTGD